MKKYKILGTGTEFLEILEIEAKSEKEAKDIYLEKWECGTINSMNYEVEVVAEGDE